MSTTITIDRPTRDVLAYELECVLRCAGSLLECGESIARDDAQKAIGEATWAFGVLDALGWDAEDERSSFELDADAELTAQLHEWRASMKKTLAYDQNSLARAERGDAGAQIVNRSMSESIRIHRDQVARAQAELAIMDALLGRFEEPIGAVA